MEGIFQILRGLIFRTKAHSKGCIFSKVKAERILISLFLILCIVLIISLKCRCVLAVSAVDPNVDFLIIEYPDEHKSNLYAPVPFTHKKHYVDYEIPCRGCHHAWELRLRDDPLKCKECHKGKTQSEAVLLRNAFHRCCMTCHRELGKQKKPTGPVRCKKCHIVIEKESRRLKE